MCCWEGETKPKLDWKNVFLNILYYSYDLSRPAYPLFKARYVKMSTARYNIEKKRKKERAWQKERKKRWNGKWRKMHRLIKKTIELFYMDTFKVDCKVKSAVVVRICLPFNWSITTASLPWSTENSKTAVTGVSSCPVNVERDVEDGC